MNDSVFEIAYKLKDCIDNSLEVQNLKKAEEEMENCEEVMALSYRYSVAQTEYSDLLKIYSQDSDECKASQHKLYLAKKALDEHPLVKNYLKCYQVVRHMYEQIDKTLFSKYREHECHGGDDVCE